MAFNKKEETNVSALVAADEKIIALNAEGWAQFVEALERPAREIPAIAELLRHKAPWD